MTVYALTYWLRVIQALNVVGVLTLIVHAFVQSHLDHRSLKKWMVGLIGGSVFGTVLVGVPFLIAGLRTEIPGMQWIWLQYGVSAGVLMPLWLDSILTIKFILHRPQYTERPRKLMVFLGRIVFIGLAVALLQFFWGESLISQKSEQGLKVSTQTPAK